MTPTVSRSRRSRPLLMALLCGLLGTGAALQGAAAATPSAQPPVSSPATAKPQATVKSLATAVKPLTSQERAQLQALVSRVRPATVRVEQCIPTACEDPDGIGSGVLVSADGLILTAYHVISGASALSVQTLDKQRYPAQVVGYNDQEDLALLRVNVTGVPFLPLAAARPSVGDTALVIGNGDGAFLKTKMGRLVGLNADAGRADFPPGTLELTAPLIPGDSGGPVVNMRGEVTGIVSYIRVTQSSEARSYAVPVTATDSRVAALRQGAKLDAPVIGIGLGGPFGDLFFLTSEGFKELSPMLKLGDTPGAFFTSVALGSPAERAGLRPLQLSAKAERVSGDIVTAVDGKRVVNFAEFQYAVRAHRPGDTVSLTVIRDGKTIQVKVTLIGRSQVQN